MSISVREARSIIRKAKRRVPEGEAITHLNITAMMDMMTILLVFMIKAMATEASTLDLSSVALPNSSSREPKAEDAVKVTVARSAILVEGEPVALVRNGYVDASVNTNNSAFGIEIVPLRDELTKHQSRLKLIAAGRNEEPSRELMIIADRDTPYRLLSAVLYSAGKAEFSDYRLIVLRPANE